jgi:phosphoserine aminotransferase
MGRAFNFSPGPGAIPEEVLLHAQHEFLDYRGLGLSVMEMSHRSKEFIEIAENAEQDIRELMNIPSNYKVLFLQGGATLQASMIPMNLLRGKTSMDFIETGHWGAKAIKEAQAIGNVNIAASSRDKGFTYVPALDTWKLDKNAAFVHVTTNETIHGVEFYDFPKLGEIPLVGDFSSTIMSRVFDVSQFGVIYAGAQKNIGPSGITVVIVREDLIGEVVPHTPDMLNYKKHVDAESMFNTPATYNWYLAGLVFKWMKKQGGVEKIEIINRRKAAKLYTALDATDFYVNRIEKSVRSIMNVPFFLKDESLNDKFLKEAQERALLNLKGHKVSGGMRASIYNAMPEAGVDALIDFLKDFEKHNG